MSEEYKKLDTLKEYISKVYMKEACKPVEWGKHVELDVIEVEDFGLYLVLSKRTFPKDGDSVGVTIRKMLDRSPYEYTFSTKEDARRRPFEITFMLPGIDSIDALLVIIRLYAKI